MDSLAAFRKKAVGKPQHFNFALDVVDHWASQPGNLQAMQWVSQDESCTRNLTFEYFSRQSHRISVLFDKLGIKEGDTMIIVLPRVPEWWELALAALRSGIIVSPATTLSTEKDIQFRCTQSKARVFVGDASSVEKLLAVRDNCPGIKSIIQVGGIAQAGIVSLGSSLEAIASGARLPSMRRSWDTPALTFFTSGTSGPPKMVRHNQVSYPLAHASTANHWYRLSPGKVLWNMAEQGWGKAAWSFFGAWHSGASLFVYDDRQPFSPKRTIDVLHRYHITTLCAAPLIYRQLVLSEARAYLAHNPPMALAHCTTAGEALNAEVARQWHEQTGLEIHEGYGQTETILLCGNFEDSKIRRGSMGKPAPGVPLYIVTTSGEEAATGEEGDIAVLLRDENGDSGFIGIFDGYIQNDNTCIRKEKTFTVDGKVRTWYLTGDKASRDVDGYFWFTGRGDDVINSAGYRIGPFEVESTLQMHPAVAESAVVSSPDSVRGEVVKAFVVLTTEHASVTQHELKQELQAFCRRHAAPYKYPRKIDFIPAELLPKTSSGKIQRSVLRKLEWTVEGKAKL